MNTSARHATPYLDTHPRSFYRSPQLIERIIHPDCQSDFQKHWGRLIERDIPPGYDYRVVTKSGEEKWIYLRNTLGPW